jgi:hypothetical protein
MMTGQRDQGTILCMPSERFRVALAVTPRLFCDALAVALEPHFEVVVAPECAAEAGRWARQQHAFDLVIVSGVDRTVDLDADLVVQIPVADGIPEIGVAQLGDRTITTMEQLLELLPTPR